MNTNTALSEPEPVVEDPTFDALPLTPDVRRAIEELGWRTPTQVQLAAYAPAVSGRDLIVQARTGTGKTGAFGIPLVDRQVRPGSGLQALVLAPTRELALQSAKELGRLGVHRGIRTAAVYGGAPMDRQVRDLRQGAEIVSGTPGRVLDHLRRKTMDPTNLKILVLDEADEMLSMGFAKELNAIIELLPKDRQTLLFSATVDSHIQRVADRHMREPEFIGLSSDQVGATTLSHFVYFVSGRGRAQELIRILEVEDPETALVFCNTKAETEQVANALMNAGFNADWLNGDLPQGERDKVMQRTREGSLRYLIATDLAARGIDVSHLTHVINFALPAEVEQYIHRTGRTGRAGRTGTAISLVSPQELATLYYLRLQYKIFPVERSIPTAGEERTRLEADRLTMLESAFPNAVDEIHRSVARRLLTHPESERLVAALLASFFGAKEGDVDELAAAERRARPAERTIVPAEKPREPEARAPRAARTRPERAERPERSERPERADRPERTERAERPEGAERAERPERADRPERAERTGERSERSDRAGAERADGERSERSGGERTGGERSRPERTRSRPERSAERSRPERSEIDRPRPDSVESADDESSDEDVAPRDMTRLFVSAGKRDGVRAGDIARFFRDRGGLSRNDVGRIRVRDKHTFVDVTTTHVERAMGELAGQRLGDLEVRIEPAKATPK
jgi:ATP-dependent RNA helicase DeaD